MQFSHDEGVKILKAARHTIELYLTIENFNRSAIENILKEFNQKVGVLVSIEHYPTGTERGTGGLVEPKESLKKAVIDASISAIAEDQRYVPVSHMEFEHIVVEVSLIEEIKHLNFKSEKELKDNISLQEGLLLKYGYHESILFPKDALKNEWTKEKYLDNLCIKAGLKEHMWKTNQVKIYSFKVQTFRESEPRGAVDEVK